MYPCAAMKQLVNRRAHMLTWTWDETTDSGLPQMSGVYASYKIICRNGTVAPFEPSRISQAMMKAFLAVHARTEFAQRTCSAWLQGMWRAILPTRVSAPAMARSTELDRPRYLASQQGQTKPHRFFGNSKPDMRNAP